MNWQMKWNYIFTDSLIQSLDQHVLNFYYGPDTGKEFEIQSKYSENLDCDGAMDK